MSPEVIVMWRHVHEALGYLESYHEQTFVVKLDNQAAARAEEVGVTRNIERLRRYEVRIVVIHPVDNLDVKSWPSLSPWADKRDIDNIRGIRDSLLKNRVPIVYGGHCREQTADKHAVQLAVALRAHKFLFLTDYDGVVNAADLLIRQTTVEDAEKYLRDGHIKPGVVKEKLERAVSAFRGGIKRVHIINGTKEDALYGELLTSEGIGTMVHSSADYTKDRRAKTSDGAMIIDIVRSAEFPVPVNLEEVGRKTGQFRVRVYDNYVHGCILYIPHEKAEALELSYLTTSREYEDAPDTEIMMREALEYAKKHDFKHVFMEAAKTQIWLGIYPWFLGMGFKRRRLREVLPGKFPEREGAEIWHLQP